MSDDDRKYRQRGYQDNPRERGPKGPQGPKQPPRERAPGRVLQDERGPKTPNLMAAHEVFRCARCGNLLSVPVGLLDRCSKCGVDIHSCIQCVSFDTSARWECTENAKLPARGAEGRAQQLRADDPPHDGRTPDQHAREQRPRPCQQQQRSASFR